MLLGFLSTCWFMCVFHCHNALFKMRGNCTLFTTIHHHDFSHTLTHAHAHRHRHRHTHGFWFSAHLYQWGLLECLEIGRAFSGHSIYCRSRTFLFVYIIKWLDGKMYWFQAFHTQHTHYRCLSDLIKAFNFWVCPVDKRRHWCKIPLPRILYWILLDFLVDLHWK